MNLSKVIIIALFAAHCCYINADTVLKKLFEYHSPATDISQNYNIARKILPKVKLPKAEGSIELSIIPWGWSNGEGKWHFFLNLSDKNAKPARRIMLYKLPDDKLRLLWEENKQSKKVTEISPKVNFQKKQKAHIAFCWKQKNGKCELKLFFNGKLLKKGYGDFELNTADLNNFLLGDSPRWNPASKCGTAIKNMVIWNKALAAEEIKLNSGNNDKGITFSKIDFVSGVKNKFSCTYTGAKEGKWELTYFDENGKLLGQESFKLTNSQNNSREWRQTEFAFTPPALAVKAVFRLKTPDKQVRIAKVNIEPGIILRKTPRHYWKGYWIWASEHPKPGSYRYFRGTFDLQNPDDVDSACMQWLTDNGSKVWLNDNYIGKVGSWATPAISNNIAKYLRKGKNVLAVKGFCHSGGAAFLGELTLNFKDYSKYIYSNGKWKVSNEAVKDWKKINFNDSAWSFVKCKYIPSQNPYGMVPYNYSGRRNNVTCVVMPRPLKVEGNKEVKVNIDLKSQTPIPFDELITVSICKNKSEITFKEVGLVKQQKGLYRIETSFCFPSDASKGFYSIQLSNPALNFTNTNIAGKIEYRPLPSTANKVNAKIAKVNGTTRLVVNGKVMPLITYKLGHNRRDSFKYPQKFQQAGVEICEVTIPFYRVWTGNKKINYDAVDTIIEKLLFAAPRSKIIVNFSIYAPDWWKRSNPDDLVAFENKKWPHADFASEKWKNESSKIVSDLVNYIEKKHCSNRIIGYFMAGGEDGQWMQWVEPASKTLSGYSKPMQQYFRLWLKRKYGTIQHLNTAWKTTFNNFKEINPPREKQRKSVPEGFILNPAKYMQLIDFQQAFSDAVTDCILEYANTIKKCSNWKKIVGVYYGKIFSIGGFNEWAELGMRRLLKAKQLDFFCGVEYFQRAPGKPHSVSAPLDSFSLHGKMFMDEADLRTFAGGAKSWAYTGNLWDTINTIKKIFAMSIVKNQALHWFDLHPGEFAAPGIMKAIDLTSKIASQSVNYPDTKGEIAIITSERGLAYCSPEAKQYSRKCIMHQWNGMFYRIGAPCDFYLLEDILRKDFPKYKMYVFLNAWVWDDQLLAAVKKLKKNNSVFVWFHAPGIIINNKMNAENIQLLTGIKVKSINTLISKVKYSKNPKIPFLKNLRDTFSYIPHLKQLFAASDPECINFGKLGTGTYPSGAFKDCGNWKSIFLSEPVMTPEIMRNIAEYAGCHIYSRSDNTLLYVGSNILGIHSASTGKKSIYFPFPCRLKDFSSQKNVNDKLLTKVEFDMEFGETKLFQIIK